MKNHIVNHITKPSLATDSTLHVISAISNPARYHSRYRLYRDWVEHIEAHNNVVVYTAESAFGDRQHEVTEASNPRHLQVRTKSEIWSKENLLNLCVRDLLPRNWKYLAWIDADVHFADPNWALEAIHQLQHFAVVQPWQHALDLGPTGNVLNLFQSFGFLHQKGGKKQVRSTDPYPYGHSGFAWACTRALWEATGGLIDFAILGSADHHMAHGMVGGIEHTVHGLIPASYLRRCLDWQRKAVRVTQNQVGFCGGRIEHQFHGPKGARGYQTRWQLMIDHKYDPDTQLTHDAQGAIQLIGNPGLEHSIHKYNAARREDSIDEV